MKYEARREKILSLLDEQETIPFQKLQEIMDASPATLRRDIVQMESAGDLIRYWGGIQRKQTPENQRKKTLQRTAPGQEHAVLGQLAAAQLKDNELIFIGSGTTTLSMIPYIENKNIHVITNGIPQLEALHRKNIQALLLCGFYKSYSRSLVGKETLDMLRGYTFDRAFLGANGINDQFCILSQDEYEDGIKRLCICQSKSTYVMVNREKFHRTAFYRVPQELSARVNLITDEPVNPSDAWIRQDDAFLAPIGRLLK